MDSNIKGELVTDKSYYVYGHYRESDGSIFYVGAGRGHRCKVFSNRSLWWDKIKSKHGVTVCLLDQDLSYKESRIREIELIAYYRKSGARLCNLTDGGEGTLGCKKSKETRLKMSISNKGKNLGKKRSLEAREKMSKARIGMVYSEETKLKMSINGKGKNKGKPAYNKGVPMSDAQKEKLRQPKTDAHKQKQSEIMKANWDKIPKHERPKVNNSGENNPRYDPRVYSFTHKNGETVLSTRFGMLEKYGVNVKRLFFAKPQIHVAGWRLTEC